MEIFLTSDEVARRDNVIDVIEVANRVANDLAKRLYRIEWVSRPDTNDEAAVIHTYTPPTGVL